MTWDGFTANLLFYFNRFHSRDMANVETNYVHTKFKPAAIDETSMWVGCGVNIGSDTGDNSPVFFCITSVARFITHDARAGRWSVWRRVPTKKVTYPSPPQTLPDPLSFLSTGSIVTREFKLCRTVWQFMCNSQIHSKHTMWCGNSVSQSLGGGCLM